MNKKVNQREPVFKLLEKLTTQLDLQSAEFDRFLYVNTFLKLMKTLKWVECGKYATPEDDQRNDTRKARSFLERVYRLTFEREPSEKTTSKTLFFLLSYQLQIRGFRDNGFTVPIKMKKILYQYLKQEREEKMSTKKTAVFAKPKEKKEKKKSMWVRLQEMLLENADKKLTDHQMVSKLKKEFPEEAKTRPWLFATTERLPDKTGRKTFGGSYTIAQWQRARMKTFKSNFKLTVKQVQGLKRFDEKGQEIKEQRKTAVLKNKSELEKIPKKAVKKAVKKTAATPVKQAQKKAIKKVAAKKQAELKKLDKPDSVSEL